MEAIIFRQFGVESRQQVQPLTEGNDRPRIAWVRVILVVRHSRLAVGQQRSRYARDNLDRRICRRRVQRYDNLRKSSQNQSRQQSRSAGQSYRSANEDPVEWPIRFAQTLDFERSLERLDL